jgi:hypothetical protein
LPTIGEFSDPVFRIAGTGVVTIDAVTVDHGYSGFGTGGGIDVIAGATLILNNSTVSNNAAGPADWGVGASTTGAR